MTFVNTEITRLVEKQQENSVELRTIRRIILECVSVQKYHIVCINLELKFDFTMFLRKGCKLNY